MFAMGTIVSASEIVRRQHANPTSIGLCGGSLSTTGRAIGDTATTRDLQGGGPRVALSRLWERNASQVQLDQGWCS